MERKKTTVIKRDGTRQEISFDKVIRRILSLSTDLDVDTIQIAQKVCTHIHDNIKTSELDDFASRLCTSLITEHPDYGILGSRLVISNNHKETPDTFTDAIQILWNNVDVHKEHKPLISRKVYEFIMANADEINDKIDNNRDYNFDFFAFKTLEKAYLLRIRDKIIERIQYLFMRVSIGLHTGNLKNAFKSYDAMSCKLMTHATPTLFNAGTNKPQLLSCFLLGTDDSITGIYDTIKHCAQISKWSGGIGFHISNIRSTDAIIRGTNGKSTGIVPMLRVYNDTARYVNQGGKRNGSFAPYLEMHHPNIMEFIDLRKNHGDESQRCRDLFTALWISDLFMEAVEMDKEWCLFDPDECPGLADTWGDEYNALYYKYKSMKKYKQIVSAREIWKRILNSHIETGTPYMLFKDNANRKSNQSNLGTIKSSNLCAEIIEYSDEKEYACCTLGSICLPRFIKKYQQPYETKFIIYTKNKCQYCDLAKLLTHEMNREIIDLSDDEVRREFYAKTSSELGKEINTMPQIWLDDTYIGGYTDLCEFMKPEYDHDSLADCVDIMIRNLDQIIDLNYYPVPETELSNKRHRPLGMGVQGLANVYAEFRIPFDSPEAQKLNKEIFETIYYAGMRTSLELARANGVYSTFKDSPISRGEFQFNLWKLHDTDLSGRYDWGALRTEIMKDGVRNSLIVALMPTASTSQIMGNNECFEPFTSNMYVRRTIAGDFIVINEYLINDLVKMGLWNNEMKQRIIADNGSIANIEEIPNILRKLYATAWEIPQKAIIDQAIGRGPFVCQSQSMNLFFEEPKQSKLTGALFHAWRGGLKTGSYYIRSRPKVQAQQFTIDLKYSKSSPPEQPADKYEVCESCSG